MYINKWHLVAILVLLAGCGGVEEIEPLSTKAPEQVVQQEVTILIENSAFVPKTLTVDVGTKVTWVNKDGTPHTVSGWGFESGTLNQSDTFSHVFTEADTWDYECSFHSYMHGSVVVISGELGYKPF